MYFKLAIGNVRRSVRDYSVYFATLVLAACLLYSFIASGDYLQALDLTTEQRSVYARIGDVLQAFSVFVVIVFIFLVAYADRFIVRRRKREFGLYALVGMPRRGVAAVLGLESGLVGLASLFAGVLLGGVLSPAFGAVAAFVFDAPWRFHASFSIGAALWTAGCFVAITALGAVASARDVLRKPVVELMGDDRRPERLAFGSRRAARLQLIAAVPLLAVVWGSCLVQPIYFIAFIMPMGFMAFGATLLVMRSVAWRFGERVRRREDAYWSGLRPFTVRQVEARVSSTSAALSCVCVLIAAAVCMTCAGACIHDVFGLCLVGFLAFAFQSSSFAPIVASVLGFTAAVMVVYCRLTCRACERLLLDREI